MLVKELIEELQKLDVEKEIVFKVSDEDEEGELEIVNNKKVIELKIWQNELNVVILHFTIKNYKNEKRKCTFSIR